MAMVLPDTSSSSNAQVGEFLGETVTLSYGNSTAEYQTLQEGCALIDLSAFARFSITGRDRARYLHGLISSEVNKLEVGTGSYGTFMNTTGRTLSDAWVYAQKDALLLILPLGVEEVVMKHLDFYLIADKADFAPLAESTQLFSVQGPKSKSILDKLGVVASVSDYHMVAGSIDGISVQIMTISRAGNQGFDILVDADKAQALWAILENNGASPVGFEALNTFRVVQGIPWSGKELTVKIIPMEANLTDIAVSFNKGCYLGQEVVAKIKYRGKVNRLMAAFELPEGHSLAEGDPVYYLGKKMGWISSIVSPPAGPQRALGFLRRSAYENADTVDLGEGEDAGKAAVIQLPA